MTATYLGYGGPSAPHFRPIIRRLGMVEQFVGLGLILFGAVALLLGLIVFRHLGYQPMLICVAVSVALILMGYLLYRPCTVFDQSGIHSRTALRSYDIPWPVSRHDFVVRRYGSAFRYNSRNVGPRAYATVRSNGEEVVLGGMITRAITSDRAYQLMEVELDRIWMWAASWGLVRLESPTGIPSGNGVPGGWGYGPAHP